MRRLLVGLVVLLVLLLGADRLGAHLAGRAVASHLRATAGLRADPAVRITGFPFLTQVLAGRYDRIEVTARDVDRGGVHLARLQVELHDVRIPLRSALSGAVRAVPVQRLSGTAVVSYADIVSGRTELTARPAAHHQLRVTGRVNVLGLHLQVSSRSTVTLRGNQLVVTAQSLSVDGQSSGLVDRALAGRLDFHVPVGSLPYGLQLSGVRITPQGLVVAAVGGPTVLRSR